MGGEPQVKLLDFGLAKFRARARVAAGSRRAAACSPP